MSYSAQCYSTAQRSIKTVYTLESSSFSSPIDDRFWQQKDKTHVLLVVYYFSFSHACSIAAHLNIEMRLHMHC